MSLISNLLFNDPTKSLVKKEMQMLMKNHKVLSSNIANVSTPGYKAVHLSFQEQMKRAVDKSGIHLERTDGRHMESPAGVKHVHPRAIVDRNTRGRIDGNTVDIDREMASMSENQIMWNSMLIMKKKLGSPMKSAINGRV